MQRAGHGYCLTNRKEIHSWEVGEKRRIWYKPDLTLDKETKVSKGIFATIKVKHKIFSIQIQGIYSLFMSFLCLFVKVLSVYKSYLPLVYLHLPGFWHITSFAVWIGPLSQDIGYFRFLDGPFMPWSIFFLQAFLTSWPVTCWYVFFSF